MSREKHKIVRANQDTAPATPPRDLTPAIPQAAAPENDDNFGIPLGSIGYSLLRPGLLRLPAATTNNPAPQNPALQQRVMQHPELILDLRDLETEDTANQKRRRIKK
jgi:hypothetical protein